MFGTVRAAQVSYSTLPRNWAVWEIGTLQSPSDRKFKSGDAEILSVSTQDTHRQTEQKHKALQLSGMMQL
jgi:hypothetical protein